MAISSSFLRNLAFATASAALTVSSAFAQAPDAATPAVATVSGPATGMTLSDGVINPVELDGIELGPGEKIISGPPEINRFIEPQVDPGATDAGYGHAMASACSPSCYVPCQPGYYLTTEALYMQLSGKDGFTRSFGYAFDDYDFELGSRITIGRRFDCVDGYEFVWAGLLEWDDVIAAAAGQTVFNSPDAVIQQAFTDLDAVPQFQARESTFNSIEFNRTYTGWDVLRALIGIRTVLFDETYTLAGAPTVLTQDTDNLLIGPQLGLHLFYPLGQRIYSENVIKGALMLNFADSDTRLISPGNGLLMVGSADDTEISGMLEFGTRFGMNVTPSIAATIGYDFWYLTGVAEVNSQLPLGFNRGTPYTISTGDDIFVHGLSGGIQVVY